MISLSAEKVSVQLELAETPVVEVAITENGVPIQSQCLAVVISGYGDVHVRWQGLPPFKVHIPQEDGAIWARSSANAGSVLVPSGGEPAVAVELVGGGSTPTGDPAEIVGVVDLREPDNTVSAAARDVVAVQRDGTEWRVVGAARSDENDGAYAVSGLVDPEADIYLIAVDDFGAPFVSGAGVQSGDLIHPTTPNGYVYRVVTGGELPATEPDWWTTGQQQVGNATLEAREYLRPLAHGPVDVTFL